MILDYWWLAPVIVALLLIPRTIRILREYDRGVVFTLGRFAGVRGPGLVLLVPWVQQLVRVTLRTVVLEKCQARTSSPATTSR